MYMFFYSNLVYFFFIIYVQHYPKLGMAMGQGRAKGWDLRPRPAWIFLAPSPPLKAPRRPAKPSPTL